MLFKTTAIIAIFAATTAAASAELAPTALFTSTAVESFDALSSTNSIFSDSVSVTAESGLLIKAQSWTFSGFATTKPHSGTHFIGSTSGPVVYDFSEPIFAFGGFFSTNTNAPDATAEFFSATGDLLATIDMSIPTALSIDSAISPWTWNGVASTEPFASVRISGNYSQGGFVMMDDIQISSTPLPTPGSLATAALAGLSMSRRRRA